MSENRNLQLADRVRKSDLSRTTRSELRGLTDTEYPMFQRNLAANPLGEDIIRGLACLRKTRWGAKRGEKAGEAPTPGCGGDQIRVVEMKAKRNAITFNAEDLIRSVEEVRDQVVNQRGSSLCRTRINLPKPAPEVTARDVLRLRQQLKLSQPEFAALLNVPAVTAIGWEKGRRKPSGAALRLLQIVKRYPEVLNTA